jgi:aryl-alcohol dehydrogenase-like predicted oxidoreductase
LQGLKEQGLVHKVGVSIYVPAELDRVCESFNVDLVQAPLNLIDQTLSTSGWLSKLKDKGVEVHTRSAFLQGLLLMARTDIPPQFAPWSPLWDAWFTWQSRHQIDAIDACIAFPLSFTEVDRVVVGADSVIQLSQIIQAAGAKLPRDLPKISCNNPRLINPSLWGSH